MNRGLTVRMPIPALFTSMSMAPSCVHAWPTARATEDSSRTSIPRPVAPGSSAATAAARAADRPVSATSAPAAARAEAIARPRPLVPPVTSTFIVEALMTARLGLRPPSKRRLTKTERLRKSLFTAATGRRAVEHPPPAGVPLAKGIRPLGRQCHRPSSNTASLGDEGVMGRLVHDQGRRLQEGCPAPRRGDRAALYRSADGLQGARCANEPRAHC